MRGDFFSVLEVDDGDVVDSDEHDDGFHGVFFSDAEVADSAVVAQGDLAELVDVIVTDPVEPVTVDGGGFAGFGFG